MVGNLVKTRKSCKSTVPGVLETVVIMEEGNPTVHPMQYAGPRRALNGRHPATAHCASGAERMRRRLAEAELRDLSERDFEAYGDQL